MDLIARLDAVRERWNVLRHPFYLRWSAGTLERSGSPITRASIAMPSSRSPRRPPPPRRRPSPS